ncbi:hypothetical protein PILCRDRAFT_821956, partial [Piloderma croceum F 1598]
STSSGNYGGSYGGSSGGSYGGSGGSYGGSGGSYGGSGGSYGGSGGSYGGSGGSYGDTTSMAYQPMYTASTMKDSKDSSSMMESSTMMEYSTSTAMAASAYSTPSYGSGASSWGGSGYDSCVQQCMASYGSMGSYMPPATATVDSTGSGATHTVIVAPTQGVLRYVPFATNASVGDTIMFMWGADEHTVTQSSQLAICNKTSDSPFASGEQNKSHIFTQTINTTETLFYYCGTPGHCEKGMFGIINPPNAAQPSDSVSSMMSAMMANNSALAAMGAYTDMQTANNSMAASWGSNIDMSQMPEWAQQYVAENVMYSRLFGGANPDVMSADGTFNLGNSNGSPYMIPMDISQAANDAASGPSSSSTPSASTSAPSVSGSVSPAGAAKTNGAQSLGSSSALVALVAVIGAFLAL